MQNIGTQAVQRILHSADPFSLLQLVAQNFPMYANALVRIKPNQTVAAAIKNNQRVSRQSRSCGAVSTLPRLGLRTVQQSFTSVLRGDAVSSWAPAAIC